jgi:hypothetical protein
MRFNLRNAAWAFALAIALGMTFAPLSAMAQSEEGREHGRGHDKNEQSENYSQNRNRHYQQGWNDGQADRAANRPRQYHGSRDNNEDQNAYVSGYNQSYPQDNGQYGNGQYQNGYNNDLPQGDYVQTCRNVRSNGNRLDATCQKRDGNWRQTSLSNVNRCTSGIANNDGRLVCGTGYNNGNNNGYNNGYGNGNGYGYGNGRGNVPAGSYTQTCRNIRANGYSLAAECETKSGKWRSTSLFNTDRCRSAIANDDGHLVCPK